MKWKSIRDLQVKSFCINYLSSFFSSIPCILLVIVMIMIGDYDYDNDDDNDSDDDDDDNNDSGSQ